MLQTKSTSLPSALQFLFAGVSVNSGTCCGGGQGHVSVAADLVALPVSSSSAVLMFPLVAWMRHLFLLSEWVLGPVEAAPGTRAAAAPGAECGFDLGEPQPLGLLEGKGELSSR